MSANTPTTSTEQTEHSTATSTPKDGLARWHEVAMSNSEATLRAILTEDAVFESPVVHTPQRGRDITAKYLASAGQVFANSGFHYVGEWRSEKSAVLEFACVVDGIAINGVDMISWNDEGLITHFKVMVRPLKGMNMLHAKMGEMLTKMTGPA
jgi:hypothetical protein